MSVGPVGSDFWRGDEVCRRACARTSLHHAGDATSMPALSLLPARITSLQLGCNLRQAAKDERNSLLVL